MLLISRPYITIYTFIVFFTLHQASLCIAKGTTILTRQRWNWSILNCVISFCFVVVFRDQDLAEALDSAGSDMEMEKGIVQFQDQSAQHRAKMWKVRRIMVEVILICRKWHEWKNVSVRGHRFHNNITVSVIWHLRLTWYIAPRYCTLTVKVVQMLIPAAYFSILIMRTRQMLKNSTM